jgi:hypothetical protein
MLPPCQLLVAGGLGAQLHMVKMLLGIQQPPRAMVTASDDDLLLHAGSRFHQLNPTFDKFMPMDDHTITNELIEIGMKVRRPYPIPPARLERLLPGCEGLTR